MVDEQQAGEPDELDSDEQSESADSGRLTQAARRERLAQLQNRIGEHAQLDGDVVVIEAGEPVVLHIELDREGVYTLTWWATQLTENGHHRWRDAAARLLHEDESIHTSALGGGYLVEIVQTANSEDNAVELANDTARVERVRELVTAFPEAVAALPDEPVPDYLLPPEPDLPPLGEADADDVSEDTDEDESEDQSSDVRA